MADTFFGFETSLNSDGIPSPDDGDCLEPEEEEYDLYNDETFGAIEDASNLDDWEQQHEHLAEIEENKRAESKDAKKKVSPQVEYDDFVKQMELHFMKGIDLETIKGFAYKKPNKALENITNHQQQPNYSQLPNDLLNQLSLSNSNNRDMSPFAEIRPNQDNSNFLEYKYTKQNETKQLTMQEMRAKMLANSIPASPSNSQIGGPKSIQTVEELERNLLHSRQEPKMFPVKLPYQQPYVSGPPKGFFPPRVPVQLPPPGLSHPLGLPPQMRPHMPHHQPMPQGILGVVPPPFMQNHIGPGPPHMPHMPPMVLMPGNKLMPQMQHLHQMQENRQNHMDLAQNMRHMHKLNMEQSLNHRQRLEETRDEYAGLMTQREKQWLLNIQMLQHSTGTPYFDDYYYTVFKDRKTKTDKENQQMLENHRFPHNNRQNRHNEMQENQLTPRVYTPLQFENSLGKLQCGSTTAPRKIIDMDVVTLDKETESSNNASRDTRKTKQLLLELEALYSLILKAEDLKNPLAISNTEKLQQLKQKQRLRELEAASTPEQKQEILKLIQKESIPVVENQNDYLAKVLNTFLSEEKFNSFMNIRKGKLLLLRLLSLLTIDAFSNQLCELWLKVLLSIPLVGRRDTATDNILPRFHSYFKRYVQNIKMKDILEIATSLVEIVKPENSRATPISHQGKAPLSFVIMNKFGASALVTMFVRSEYLISTGNVSDVQLTDWSNFVVSWADTCTSTTVALPIELIPPQIFTKHTNRILNLSADRKATLQKWFMESASFILN